MLRFLYGLPIFEATGTSTEEGIVDPIIWNHLCVAADRLGIPSLRTHALPKLEAYVTRLLVNTDTGHIREDASIPKFVQAVELIYTLLGEHETAARDMVLKLCLKHYAMLEKDDHFRALTDEQPAFLRGMLGHATRNGGTLTR